MNADKAKEASREAWITARAPALRKFAILASANVIVLVFALAQGWDAGEILVLYWLDAAVVGGFTVLKALFASRGTAAESLVFWRRALDRVKFFATKLAFAALLLFAQVALLALAFIWIETLAEVSSVALPSVIGTVRYALLVLFLGHAVSFVRDRIAGGPVTLEKLGLGDAARAPVTIYIMLIGSLIFLDVSPADKADASASLLLVFVFAKIAMDLLFCLNDGWPGFFSRFARRV